MGRPRLFDRDDVLRRARDLFWSRGFHDVSVRDLAAEMGVNVATIYSEFGDKDGLFRAALAHYEGEMVPFYVGPLEQPEAGLDAVRNFLTQFARFAESGQAPGCLIINTAIEHAPDAAFSGEALNRYRARIHAGFVAALAKPGVLQPGSDVDQLAAALTATALGLIVMVRAGTPSSVVLQAAQAALDTLPVTTSPATPSTATPSVKDS